jgi:hypothetical protein
MHGWQVVTGTQSGYLRRIESPDTYVPPFRNSPKYVKPWNCQYRLSWDW